jgi:DNA polymerase-3 subunit alpha
MYISAHPLDDFLPEIDAFCDGRGLSALGNLPAIKGQDLRLAVIITSFIERTSQKTNKPYCIFTAEDFETSHEFRIFGEDYLKFRTFLSAGDKVMLQGNVQSYKYAQNPGDLEFKITRIEPLFKIRDLYAHFLDITIPLQRLNDELIERIANTIQNGQGKAKVRMKIQTPNGDLNLPSNVFNRVSVDPEALQALQTISEINVSLAEK